jgi:hypothetical protein
MAKYSSGMVFIWLTIAIPIWTFFQNSVLIICNPKPISGRLFSLCAYLDGHFSII